MKKGLFLGLLIYSSGLCAARLGVLTHPYYNDISPLEARPVMTLPAVNGFDRFCNHFHANLLAGSSLPYSRDAVKSVLPNFFRQNLGNDLISLGVTSTGLDEFTEVSGEALKILEKGTTEHSRLGLIFEGGMCLGSNVEEAPADAIFVGFKLPIIINASHFWLPFAEQKKLIDLFKKGKEIIKVLTAGADEDALDLSINLDDLRPFLYSINLDPVDFKSQLFLPEYRHNNLKARLGLEATLSFDVDSPRIPEYLSINRADLANFKPTGDKMADLTPLLDTITDHGLTVGLKSPLAALYLSRVLAYAQKWGHSVGPVVRAEFEVRPDKVSLFANASSNLVFGQVKNMVMAVDGLNQLCQFQVHAKDRWMGNFNTGLRWKNDKWQLHLGFDIFGASAQNVDLVFGAYNEKEKIDYFLQDLLSLKIKQKAHFIWQHRIFAGMCYQKSENLQLMLNADFTVGSSVFPKTINFVGGVRWAF